MGYNESCSFQNCSSNCCNFKGDCPQWYTSSSDPLYSDCYYYYGTNPKILLWTTICTAVGLFLLILVACYCYREYKKKQEELRKEGEGEGVGFQISQQNVLDNKPDVMVLGDKDRTVIMPERQEGSRKNTGPLVPYGQPLNMTQYTQATAIYGIGNRIDKQL